MGPDLRRLRHFLALAEERSLTRAAQRLHLTQQALSLAVRQLQQRVGTEVVVRRTGGVELTAAGATLVEHARETVAAADRLQAAMGEHRDGRRGRPRVGLQMDGAGPLTAPILPSATPGPESSSRCASSTRPIGLRDLVLTVPAHYVSSYGAERFGIRYVPAPEIAPVPFVVAHLAGAPGPLVALFCRIAREVTRELIALIPGAEARAP